MTAILLLLLSAAALDLCQAELFTAMSHLEPIARVEQKMSSRIEDYIDKEMEKIEKLRQMAKQYKEAYEKKETEGVENLAKNPLNRLLSLKRLTSDWKFVYDFMRTEDAQRSIASFRRIVSQAFLGNITGFPSEEDLKGAATAIFRIQDVYRLTVGDLADGKIAGVKKLDVSMTAQDCFEVGRHAYFSSDYYHTIQWMDEALRRARKEKHPTVDETDIYDYLSYSLYQQGNIQRAWSYAKKILAKKPNDERAKDNVKYYAGEMAEAGIKQNSPMPPVTNMRPNDAALPERDVYESLCRGESHKAEKEKKLLRCYYKMDRPFLKLAPLKVEVVHLKPLAVLFRNILSDIEIEVIKDMATPIFKRATVHNKATGQLEHASYRISKSAWLKSRDHPAIEKINVRLDHMTNLDQDAAEDFQVANYGLGGHYDPHFDHSTRDEEDPFEDGQGNRIATVLFYVEAPLAGGATVFLPPKVACFPTKYDALFWYNLHPNGDPDDRTRHAACPVLAGQKWVSNKWIHERKQEFRRPCTLVEEGEELRIPELDRYNHCRRTP